ncbi:MAG: hypothetical protein VB858_13450 [Planctomycetaceae bacterium]
MQTQNLVIIRILIDTGIVVLAGRAGKEFDTVNYECRVGNPLKSGMLSNAVWSKPGCRRSLPISSWMRLVTGS